MTVTKSEKPRGRRALIVKIGRIALAILPWAALAVVAAVGWQRYGNQVVTDPRFQVTAEKLDITPLPQWIKSDIKSEVVRDGSLETLSLLDTDATLNINQAFAMHSWVAKVARVSKHASGQVTVELVYRQPVAMVVAQRESQSVLWPVDCNGVLLNPNDFTGAEARAYPRIVVSGLRPHPPVGTIWVDSRVTGATKIANLLSDVWQKTGLYRIATTDSGDPLSTGTVQYVLSTRNDIEGQATHVIWGYPPGEETKGEVAADQKRIRLCEYVKRHGPLGKSPEISEIDLRDQRQLQILPRTANRQLPANHQ